AYYAVRGMQGAARELRRTLGTAASINTYEIAKNNFLNLNTSIRVMKNSGLMNAMQVGVAFDQVRNAFENVRGHFISRWKNRLHVESSAENAIGALRYSIERMKQILDIPAAQPPV